MYIGDHLGDGETKTGASSEAVAGHIEPFEGFEKPIYHPCGKTWAIVIHLDHHFARDELDAEPCTLPIFNGVLDQIAQQALEHVRTKSGLTATG